jgi:hypothetical protein
MISFLFIISHGGIKKNEHPNRIVARNLLPNLRQGKAELHPPQHFAIRIGALVLFRCLPFEGRIQRFLLESDQEWQHESSSRGGMKMEKKFTFSFEHSSGMGGYYIRADSIKEADALFIAKCNQEELNRDDYMLVRIQEGDFDGPWIWDLYRDIGDNFPHHLEG